MQSLAGKLRLCPESGDGSFRPGGIGPCLNSNLVKGGDTSGEGARQPEMEASFAAGPGSARQIVTTWEKVRSAACFRTPGGWLRRYWLQPSRKWRFPPTERDDWALAQTTKIIYVFEIFASVATVYTFRQRFLGNIQIY